MQWLAALRRVLASPASVILAEAQCDGIKKLWESHKADFVASYKSIASVRERIGFAGMLNHGWLTADRSVQFTDWDTGDRVIVNFGDRPFVRKAKGSVLG
jgi:hypothetical protein